MLKVKQFLYLVVLLLQTYFLYVCIQASYAHNEEAYFLIFKQVPTYTDREVFEKTCLNETCKECLNFERKGRFEILDRITGKFKFRNLFRILKLGIESWKDILTIEPAVSFIASFLLFFLTHWLLNIRNVWKRMPDRVYGHIWTIRINASHYRCWWFSVQCRFGSVSRYGSICSACSSTPSLFGMHSICLRRHRQK